MRKKSPPAISDPPPAEPQPRVQRLPDDSHEIEPVEAEVGISLDQLSQSFGRLFGQSDTDRVGQEKPDDADEPHIQNSHSSPIDLPFDNGTDPLGDDEEDQVVSPSEIIEAILFVGHPEGEPISSRYIASLMRGVSPKEVEQLVDKLHERYQEQACPYAIESEGRGYRMTLRNEFTAVRERFYSRIRQARLSQSAIDVLSLVAYHQPMTRAEVDEIYGRPSGSLLGQLVRRELLSLKTNEVEGKMLRQYGTTDRFLQFFGLESVADLPRTQETT